MKDIDDTEITGGDPDFARITLQKPTGTKASDISVYMPLTFPTKKQAKIKMPPEKA